MLGRGTARTISTFDMTLETSTWAPTAPPMANAVKRPATLDALRPAVVRGFEPQIRFTAVKGIWHVFEDVQHLEWLESLNGEEQGMCLRCYYNYKTINCKMG